MFIEMITTDENEEGKYCKHIVKHEKCDSRCNIEAKPASQASAGRKKSRVMREIQQENKSPQPIQRQSSQINRHQNSFKYISPRPNT